MAPLMMLGMEGAATSVGNLGFGKPHTLSQGSRLCGPTQAPAYQGVGRVWTLPLPSKQLEDAFGCLFCSPHSFGFPGLAARLASATPTATLNSNSNVRISLTTTANPFSELQRHLQHGFSRRAQGSRQQGHCREKL